MKTLKDEYKALLPFGAYASECTSIFEHFINCLDNNPNSPVKLLPNEVTSLMDYIMKLNNDITGLRLQHERYVINLKNKYPTLFLNVDVEDK